MNGTYRTVDSSNSQWFSGSTPVWFTMLNNRISAIAYWYSRTPISTGSLSAVSLIYGLKNINNIKRKILETDLLEMGMNCFVPNHCLCCNTTGATPSLPPPSSWLLQLTSRHSLLGSFMWLAILAGVPDYLLHFLWHFWWVSKVQFTTLKNIKKCKGLKDQATKITSSHSLPLWCAAI